MKPFLKYLREVWDEGVNVSLAFFKLTIPVIIVVKILVELGMVKVIAAALGPLMAMFGLSDDMGLVWATAMFVNVYSALVVLFNLPSYTELTAEQITVLSTMMLIAHALPIEIRIAQKAGARARAILAIRAGSALCVGLILHWTYQWGGWLQQPAKSLWAPQPMDASIGAWAWNQVVLMGKIFLIILSIVAVLRALDAIGAMRYVHKALKPMLRGLGIGAETSTLTVVGMTLGVSYGGALIIREAQLGHVSRRDAFLAMALLGMTHSIFEDTILLMTVGASVSGIVAVRLIWTAVAILLLAKAMDAMSAESIRRWFIREDMKAEATAD